MAGGEVVLALFVSLRFGQYGAIVGIGRTEGQRMLHGLNRTRQLPVLEHGFTPLGMHCGCSCTSHRKFFL